MPIYKTLKFPFLTRVSFAKAAKMVENNKQIGEIYLSTLPSLFLQKMRIGNGEERNVGGQGPGRTRDMRRPKPRQRHPATMYHVLLLLCHYVPPCYYSATSYPTATILPPSSTVLPACHKVPWATLPPCKYFSVIKCDQGIT